MFFGKVIFISILFVTAFVYTFFFLTGDIRFGTPEEGSLADDRTTLPSNTATSAAEDRPMKDVRAPPNLYFDVEESKENKYTSYEELRKKHRERWNPPALPSSGPSRMEQVSQVDYLFYVFILGLRSIDPIQE